MSWYKEAASPNKIIQDYGITDPIMQYFLINIGANLLNFKNVTSKEDIYALVDKKYRELKASIPQKTFVNLKLIEKSLPRMRQNPAFEYEGKTPEEIVELINAKKKVVLEGGFHPVTEEPVFGWIDEIETEHNFNPAFAYMALNYAIKLSDKKSHLVPPPVDAAVLTESKDIIESGNTSVESPEGGQATLNFASLYNNAQQNIANKEEGSAPSKDGWMKFEKDSDPKALANFCAAGRWCIAGEGAAESYLKTGDVYIYSEKGKPRIAFALHGSDRAREVRAAGNTSPNDYAEQILDFAEKKGIEGVHYASGGEDLKHARGLNRLIESDPENPDTIREAKEYPTLIYRGNRKGQYLDIYVQGWEEKISGMSYERFKDIPDDIISSKAFQTKFINKYIIPKTIREFNRYSYNAMDHFPSFLANNERMLSYFSAQIEKDYLDDISKIPEEALFYLQDAIIQKSKEESESNGELGVGWYISKHLDSLPKVKDFLKSETINSFESALKDYVRISKEKESDDPRVSEHAKVDAKLLEDKFEFIGKSLQKLRDDPELFKKIIEIFKTNITKIGRYNALTSYEMQKIMRHITGYGDEHDAAYQEMKKVTTDHAIETIVNDPTMSLSHLLVLNRSIVFSFNDYDELEVNQDNFNKVIFGLFEAAKTQIYKDITEFVYSSWRHDDWPSFTALQESIDSMFSIEGLYSGDYRKVDGFHDKETGKISENGKEFLQAYKNTGVQKYKAQLNNLGQMALVQKAIRLTIEDPDAEIPEDVANHPQFVKFFTNFLEQLKTRALFLIEKGQMTCNHYDIPTIIRTDADFINRCEAITNRQLAEKLNPSQQERVAMNWYKKSSLNKVASVDFFLEGIEKISKPMTVLDICNDLSEFGHYTGNNFNEGQGMHMDSISPDGDSAFNWTGTINIYVPDNRSVSDPDSEWGYRREDIPEEEMLKEEQVKALIKGYNGYKHGIVLGYPTKDVSNMTGKDVYRVPVIRNETQNIDQIPSLNVSNANAEAFLRLLKHHGLNVDAEEYAGSFGVEDYIGARQLMSDDSIKQFQRDTVHEGNMFSAGLTLNMIKRYLQVLDQMVSWAYKNDLPVKEINFG